MPNDWRGALGLGLGNLRLEPCLCLIRSLRLASVVWYSILHDNILLWVPVLHAILLVVLLLVVLVGSLLRSYPLPLSFSLLCLTFPERGSVAPGLLRFVLLLLGLRFCCLLCLSLKLEFAVVLLLLDLLLLPLLGVLLLNLLNDLEALERWFEG